MTGLVADLQVSSDGGTTFVNLQAGVLVAATPIKIQSPLVGGLRYRINVTTPPTAADFYVSIN